MAERSPRPVDRLLGGYLLLTAVAFVFPHRTAAWPALLLVHLVLGAVLLAGGAEKLRRPPHPVMVRAIGDWYPLLLMPFLYWELPHLITPLWDGRFFDPVILAWEERLFGHQPSGSLARTWPSLALSEALHLAYLSYYPIIYVPAAALYLRQRRAAFQETVFALMLGFTVCYVIFILFPVQGPRYLFPPPAGAPSDGFFYGVTHAVLESGSSQGAAFPSSHAAIAAIQTISVARHLPVAAPLLGLLALGISVGAVYGGFHYAVDMAAGLALGLLLSWLSPAVRTALR